MDRFVKLMDTISSSKETGVGITELSRQTMISKGTLHRMLQNMLIHQLVVQNPETKKYMLGPRSMKWGSTFLQGQDPVGLLADYCERLGGETKFYTFICRFQSNEIFCTHTHQPSDVRNSFFVHVGQRMPLHCAAAAEIILAYQPDEIVSRMLESETLKAYTPFTITDKKEIIRKLHDARSRRIAFCMQELELGVSAISVPIFYRPDRAAVSISVVGEHHDIEAKKDSLVRELNKISDEASEHLMSMNTLSSLI